LTKQSYKKGGTFWQSEIVSQEAQNVSQCLVQEKYEDNKDADALVEHEQNI